MSLRFNWPKFTTRFSDALIPKIEEFLSQAPPNPALVGVFKIKSLHIGSQGPHISLQAIEDLTLSQQTFLIHFEYASDFSIEIINDIQMNKLFVERQDYMHMSLLGASQLSQRASIMPLNLKISELRIEGKMRVSLRKKPSGGSIATVQLLQNPIKSIKIQSNFDEHISLAGNIIRFQIMDTLNREIEANLVKNKVEIDLEELQNVAEESESSSDEEDEEIERLIRSESATHGEKVAK